MIITPKHSKHVPNKSFPLRIILEKYPSGNTRINLTQKGLRSMTATSDLGFPIPKNLVLIKNYSENEGILKDLQEAKVIGEVIEEIPSGFIKLQLCELLIKEENLDT